MISAVSRFQTVKRGRAQGNLAEEEVLSLKTVASVILVILFSGCTSARSPARNGCGWRVTRLDIEVLVRNDQPSMRIRGTLRVHLDCDRSFGPSLRINEAGSGIRWLSLKAPGAVRIDLNDQSGSATLAHVRYKQAFTKGHELELGFELETTKRSSQLVVREDVALASWVHAWYPHAAQLDNAFTAHTMSAPGKTTFRLPAGWIALSDGKLVSRDAGEHETVEVWEQGERSVARSFTAGPFRAAKRVLDGRTIRIYLRNEYAIGVDRLADLLVKTMAAQVARLGEFPFESYGVVEVPNNVATWHAASQQTFIMAKSDAFKFTHGNVAIWAHEMGHAWWGNTVIACEPGSMMAGEALAQLGVVMTLQALEGREATGNFLDEVFFRGFPTAGLAARTVTFTGLILNR